MNKDKIKKQESSPFDEYKDTVEYDFVIRATMPLDYKGTDKHYRPDEDQIGDGAIAIQDQVESMLHDEDVLKMYFESPGVGRVYAKLNDFIDKADITFGISSIDSKEPLDIEKLKEEAKDFMEALEDNLESESVTGVYAAGFDDDTGAPDDYETEPTSIKMVKTGKPKIEVINELKTESKTLKTEEMNPEIADKLLVQLGSLKFKDEKTGSIIEYKLNDDGVIEIYVDSKLTNTLPFAKLSIQRECKKTLQEGFTYTENEDIDLDATKQDIEAGIEKVKEIQELKDELESSVETLQESEEITTEVELAFPSSEFTEKQLSAEDILNLDLETQLTDEQKDYIKAKFNSIQVMGDALKNLCDISELDDEIISINKYIDMLSKEGV